MKLKRFTIFRLSVLLCFWSLLFCSESMAADDGVYLGEKTEFEKYGYVVRESKWEFKLGMPSRIFVCWENPTDGNARAREITQVQVTDTWEKVSALEFSGWGQCQNDNDGIRILYEDSGPHVKEFGSEIDGIDNGMVLNHIFDKWKPGCPFDNETCIRSIAVHEFGHALGFAHEQNRPDTPGECAAKHGQDQPNEIILTPYDSESIMNYCNDDNDGTLSQFDILAVQKMYGKP